MAEGDAEGRKMSPPRWAGLFKVQPSPTLPHEQGQGARAPARARPHPVTGWGCESWSPGKYRTVSPAGSRGEGTRPKLCMGMESRGAPRGQWDCSPPSTSQDRTVRAKEQSCTLG